MLKIIIVIICHILYLIYKFTQCVRPCVTRRFCVLIRRQETGPNSWIRKPGSERTRDPGRTRQRAHEREIRLHFLWQNRFCRLIKMRRRFCNPSLCSFVRPSLRPSVCPSVRPSVRLSVRLSVRSFVRTYLLFFIFFFGFFFWIFLPFS